jgi:hypothetical protein
LHQGAASAASPQLRNQGTLGGNLCQRPRCWYFRGDFHCTRKGGDTCFASMVAAYEALSDGMKKLIMDLLDLTRFESGQRERVIARVDVRELARRLTQTYHDHHDQSVAALHVHHDPASCLEGPVDKGAPAAGDEDEDVEIDESLDDAAFIEEEEEGDADVTDIIGETIEKEEET